MSTTTKIAIDLFEEAKKSYEETAKITDDQLQALHLLLGPPFLQALEIIERPKIRKYITKSGLTSVYTVLKGYEQNLIFENINFCTCADFQTNVLEENKNITCKHVIAIKLAEIPGKYSIDTISPEQFSEFIENELDKIK